MIRSMTLAGLTLALLVAAAPAPRNDPDPEPTYKTKRYKSAQACFDAYAAANDKKDYKTAYDCLSPESQKDVAAFTVYLMASLKDQLPEEFKKAFEPVYDVMDKHGLTEKALKDVKAEGNLVMKMPEKSRLALRKLIKKPLAFLIDMGMAQTKIEKEGGFGAFAPGKITMKLTDLKVSGDKAKGTLVSSSNGTESKQSLEFVKLNVGWKMVPSLEIPTPEVAPPPAIKKNVKD